MCTKLVLLGGAPGVGKSTVARLLLARLSGCAWLDGDDLWRTNPFRVDDVTRPMVERNIRFVLRNYVHADFRCVIFTWVLHLQPVIDLVLDGLRGLDVTPFPLTLVCDEATLLRRCAGDAGRTTDPKLAARRLRQSRELATTRIDTTARRPDQIADAVIDLAGLRTFTHGSFDAACARSEHD